MLPTTLGPVKTVFQAAYHADKEFEAPAAHSTSEAVHLQNHLDNGNDKTGLYLIGFENLRSKQRQGLSKTLKVIEKFLDHPNAVWLYLEKGLNVFNGLENQIDMAGPELYEHLVTPRGTTEGRNVLSRSMSNLRSQSLTDRCEDSKELQEKTVRIFNRVRKFREIVAQQEKIAALHSQYKTQEEKMEETVCLYGALISENCSKWDFGLGHHNGDHFVESIESVREYAFDILPILNNIEEEIKAEEKVLAQLKK